MSKFAKLARRFRSEDDGAAMIEYTVLVGMITAGVIAAIVVMAAWMGTQWTALCTAVGQVC